MEQYRWQTLLVLSALNLALNKMNIFIRSITFALLEFVAACSSKLDTDRSEMVSRFIISMYEDTGYYKEKYGGDTSLVPIFRTKMSKQFKIVREEDIGGGSFDYIIAFDNGAKGIVSIYKKDGLDEIEFVISKDAP